jgi:hypothetical protein
MQNIFCKQQQSDKEFQLNERHQNILKDDFKMIWEKTHARSMDVIMVLCFQKAYEVLLEAEFFTFKSLYLYLV